MRLEREILRFRPPTVVNRLGGRDVPLLGGRDVSRAWSDEPGTLLYAMVGLPGVIRPLVHAVLRAARQYRAVVGLLAPAYLRGSGPRPHALFEAVVAAADEAGHELPFVLCAGPLRLFGDRGERLEGTGELAFQHADEGFTDLLVDLSGAPDATSAAGAVAGLRARFGNDDLGLQLRVPEDVPLLELAQALEAQAAGRVDAFFSARGSLASGAPAALAVFDARKPQELSGRSRATAHSIFEQLAVPHLPADLRRRMSEQAAGEGAVASALGSWHRELPTLDASAQLAIEAAAYYEAVELLEASEARGSAERVAKAIVDAGE